MSFAVSTTGVALPTLSDDVRSVDVFFGEDRVWSIDLNVLPDRGASEVAWPDAILPHLRGSTRVELHDSATGTLIAATDARFTDEPVTTRIVDEDGVPLALNKWGRLGKTLEAGNPGVQERILDRTAEVIAHLEEMGLRPFVVGGTLLGAVRDHALLPHDDDADVAYLSTHTNPADVAREGFAIGRALESLGYELVRHSATHMQLYFRTPAGALDHYVDVFSAFFTEDGRINQPFHVRGEMRENQMLPFSTVTIQDRPFPAPADPEHWLVINYDEHWRTPIPGYRLETPRATVRRFQNWFGSFHRSRDFWNDFFRDSTGASASSEATHDGSWSCGADWILREQDRLTAPALIDLGSGDGWLSARLAEGGSGSDTSARRVIAADYSPYARALAEATGTPVTTAHVNLSRVSALSLPRDTGIEGAFDLVANHLLDHLGPHARPQALRLIRMALRSGGVALATLYSTPDPAKRPPELANPGIAPDALTEEAAALGLDVEIVPLTPTSADWHRAPYGVRFTQQPSAATAQSTTQTASRGSR